MRTWLQMVWVCSRKLQPVRLESLTVTLLLHVSCRSVLQPIVVDSDDEEADEKLEQCMKHSLFAKLVLSSSASVCTTRDTWP